MKNDFRDDLDCMTLVFEEMIQEHGEDSYYCRFTPDSAIISVFDGCGGLGSRIYERFGGGRTGAYMASHTVSGAIRDWYNAYDTKNWTSSAELTESIGQYIKSRYDVIMPYADSTLKISGTMVRDFPTTAAIAVARHEKGKIALHIVWAGDSRVYLLDEDGLAQLTLDDVDGEDAMSNLSDDGALTNVISSDGMYELHYKKQMLDKPAIVIAATDGCFGYVPSPMHFEYGLLECIDTSGSFSELEEMLKRHFSEMTGDDYTFGMMCFSFGSYACVRSVMEKRRLYMEQNYSEAIQPEADEDTLYAIWETYKKNYERDLR